MTTIPAPARLAALAATVMLAGAVSLAVPPPAHAATCAGSSGVSVVVDYRELGGGVVTGCAADGGGKSASAILAAAGVSLTYATRQPGFVCRVNGAPASDPCVNASPSNAYWGLWSADGSSGWTWSTSGVGSLSVEDGGSVGLSWQQDRAAGQAAPPTIAAPVNRNQGPSTSPSPTTSLPSPTRPSATAGSNPAPGTGTKPGGSPSGPVVAGPGVPATTAPSPSAAATATPSAQPTKRAARKNRSAATRPSPAESASPGADPAGDTRVVAGPESAADQPQAIPAWLTWAVFALLALGLVVGAVLGRRRARA